MALKLKTCDDDDTVEQYSMIFHKSLRIHQLYRDATTQLNNQIVTAFW